jgi:hypothetical protein
MPQYLSFFTAKEQGPPSAERMEKMGKLMIEMTAKGVLVATGGFQPGPSSFRVKHINGDFTVATGVPPGPAQGFALLQGPDRETVVEGVKQFLEIAGDGTCELHPLMGPPPQK